MRRALLVADSGNRRIQVLALPQLELADTWDGAGRLERPQSLAADADGNVYVADAGSGRLEKLDPLLGEPVAGFRSPSGVTAAEVAVLGDRVFALDASSARVHVLGPGGAELAYWDTGLTRPLGLAVSGSQVLVGDLARRRLLVFRPDGTPVGEAYGYEGPVAAVCPDGADRLLLHVGDAHTPLRLSSRGAHRRRGLLWGGPFRNPSPRDHPRHLVRATVDGIGPGAHVALFVAERRDDSAPPDPDPDAENPFADAAWRSVAPDATETLLQGAYRDVLWLGMTFATEGTATAAVSQLRIDFDHEPYLRYLPPLYQRDHDSRELLARWLTVFESGFDRTRTAIEDLAQWLDEDAAPDAPLPQLAEAFRLTARRGTTAGLRQALRLRAGVEAVVEEPIVQAGWWALADADAPEEQAALSVLGARTTLAVGEPQGAVTGTTAVLDGSFLAAQEDYGRALFTDVAHQLTVRVYRGAAYSEAAVAEVRAILDRERPAHTTYHLCVVEPCMRVGIQARVGVDAIVARGPEGRLGSTPLGGTYLRRSDA